MKVKDLISILQAVAAIYSDAGNRKFAEELVRFSNAAMEFKTLTLEEFLTSCSADPSDSAAKQLSESTMPLRDLTRSIEVTAALLKASGSGAKARKLSAAADQLGKLPHGSAEGLIEANRSLQQQASTERIGRFVQQLRAAEQSSPEFEKVLDQLKKCAPAEVVEVAVGYVQGRSNYPSRPKAIAAIKDKQFERARLATRMAQD